MTDTASEPTPDTGPFTYKIGDTEIVLPNFKRLPLGIVRKTRNAADEEKTFLLLEALFDEGSPEMEALDSLDVDGFGAMLTSWQEAAGVTLGESSAS